MMRSLKILTLGCMSLFAGCDAEVANWNAPVLSKAENPSNGAYNFTSSRAEVIAYHCGLLHSSCVSVRLLDETGFANSQGGRLFTYRGIPQAISIRWKDPQTLLVSCHLCNPKKIERKLTEVNYTHIKYEI
jgi:hypothetical protein